MLKTIQNLYPSVIENAKFNIQILIYIVIIIQCASQDFKGHLDIDYIWVFNSFYVNTGIRVSKKPNLSFSSVGQIFYDALKTPRQSRRQKTFKKWNNFPNTALFGLFKSSLHVESKNDPFYCFHIPSSTFVVQIITFLQYLANY